MSKLREQLDRLSAEQPSDWKERARYRRENRVWLTMARVIAMKVLDAMHAQGLTKIELAERMPMSSEQFNQIVKGQANSTLETIAKLERVLGIKIMGKDLL